MKTTVKLLNLLIYSYIAAILYGCAGGPPLPANRLVPTVEPEPVKPCVYNVYVENSGSMYGYVKGVTEFEQSVYSYLSDIKISDICSEMNLFYINSEMLEQPDDVEDFIYKLEPTTFRAKGGNMSTTDISNIIGNILDVHGRDTVSILISDFVFSPGSGINADEYLINQQIGIKNHFAIERKANPDLAMMLYRLSSRFEGKYYDRNNVPYRINHQRPFYMMIIGDSRNLKALSDEIPSNSIKGSGVINSYSISQVNDAVEYGIVTEPRIGDFQPDPKSPMTGIRKAKIDKKNPDTKFLISIGVDFSDILLDDEYLMSPSNYDISNKSFILDVDKAKNGKYTHIIKLSLNPLLVNLYKGPLSIRLLKHTSTWGEEATNMDDTGIEKITTDKTYGLKYLVNGVYDAYGTDKEYAEFNINIR